MVTFSASVQALAAMMSMMGSMDGVRVGLLGYGKGWRIGEEWSRLRMWRKGGKGEKGGTGCALI